MDARKIIQWTMSGLGMVIIIGYSFFVLNDFIRGPRILITSPESGYATSSAFITISGKVIHANDLTVNDGAISVDLEGNFNEQLILAPGYNIIKVAAVDAYKRSIEKTIELTLVSAPDTIEVPKPVLVTENTTLPITIIRKPVVNTPGAEPVECAPGDLYSVVTGKPCP